jgi:hypothetical protein
VLPPKPVLVEPPALVLALLPPVPLFVAPPVAPGGVLGISELHAADDSASAAHHEPRLSPKPNPALIQKSS